MTHAMKALVQLKRDRRILRAAFDLRRHLTSSLPKVSYAKQEEESAYNSKTNRRVLSPDCDIRFTARTFEVECAVDSIVARAENNV